MGQILKPYQPTKRYIPKVIKHEESLQQQVCSYLRLQYPKIIFRSDVASGMKLTMHQAVKNKRLQSSRAFPDLFIFAPMQHGDKMYYGLGIELKRPGTRIILTTGPNKGHLTSDPHIREQYLMCKQLKELGYYATICVGLDQTVSTIDWYFKRQTMTNNELF